MKIVIYLVYFKIAIAIFFFCFVNNSIGDIMKRILITGASSGIASFVINKIKNKNDYYIYVTVRTNKQLELVNIKYKDDKNIECFKLDITNDQDIEKVKKLDIDILINNAAVGEGGSVACINIERLVNNYEVNVFGTVKLTQIVLNNMLAKGTGKIINIASLAGVMPISFLGSYAATKSSIIKLSIALKNELKLINRNIKVVLIEPGFYHTGFNQVMIDNKYNDYNSYFNNCINIIRKRESIMLKLLEKNNLNSITNKIVKAIKTDNPRFIYRAPITQAIFSKIYELFH